MGSFCLEGTVLLLSQFCFDFYLYERRSWEEFRPLHFNSYVSAGPRSLLGLSELSGHCLWPGLCSEASSFLSTTKQ